MTDSNIVKVTVAEFTKKDGSFSHYGYTGHTASGGLEVVRAKSTRLYENAFQYDFIANGSGKSGLAPYFCFGKKSAYKTPPIATFKVEFYKKEMGHD